MACTVLVAISDVEFVWFCYIINFFENWWQSTLRIAFNPQDFGCVSYMFNSISPYRTSLLPQPGLSAAIIGAAEFGGCSVADADLLGQDLGPPGLNGLRTPGRIRTAWPGTSLLDCKLPRQFVFGQKRGDLRNSRKDGKDGTGIWAQLKDLSGRPSPKNEG